MQQRIEPWRKSNHVAGGVACREEFALDDHDGQQQSVPELGFYGDVAGRLQPVAQLCGCGSSCVMDAAIVGGGEPRIGWHIQDQSTAWF